MKTLIDYYDDFANEWADEWYQNETLLPYLKELIKYLPNNARVLDLCCGAGYESMRLHNLGVNVVGADLSEKSIELAREKNPQIPFYVKDMLQPYTDLGDFDAVACIAGVVHIPEQNLHLAFKNMYDVIKNDGYLFLVVKDGEKIVDSIVKNNQEYARKFFCYTLNKLKQYTQTMFEFIKEFNSDTNWKYYLFKKI